MAWDTQQRMPYIPHLYVCECRSSAGHFMNMCPGIHVQICVSDKTHTHTHICSTYMRTMFGSTAKYSKSLRDLVCIFLIAQATVA
jgi:hypothetical protein